MIYRTFITASFVATLLFLNLKGWIQFHLDSTAIVSSIGWPVSIVGLSSEPGSIPVPGMDFGALIVDLLFGMLVIAGICCCASARLLLIRKVRIHHLLLITGVFATWLMVVLSEGAGQSDVLYVIFELSRIWVFIGIVLSWCGACRIIAVCSKKRPL